MRLKHLPPCTHSNWTLTGVGLSEFVSVVTELLQINRLWSCFCDKKGDWFVSTEDDTNIMEVVAIINRLNLGESAGIVDYGEITTCFEEIPEFVHIETLPRLELE